MELPLHHHPFVKYSNIRGSIADSIRQTCGNVWFVKSNIRLRIFEYSCLTKRKCYSLVVNSRRNQDYIQGMGIGAIVHPFPVQKLSSGCIRYAVFTMEASRNALREMTEDVHQYFTECRRYMHNAIECCALLDVMTASFVLFLSDQHAVHFNAVTTAFVYLQPFSVPEANIVSAFELYVTALQSFEISDWDKERQCVLNPRGRRKQHANVYDTVSYENTKKCLRRIRRFSLLRTKMRSTHPLRSHLMFALDNFLAMKINAGMNSGDCTAQLRGIIDEIMKALPPTLSIPSEFDIASANRVTDTLLYGLAILLRQLMDANGDVANDAVVKSAKWLYMLCIGNHTVPRDLLRTYCIFLVGLVHHEGIPQY